MVTWSQNLALLRLAFIPSLLVFVLEGLVLVSTTRSLVLDIVPGYSVENGRIQCKLLPGYLVCSMCTAGKKKKRKTLPT